MQKNKRNGLVFIFFIIISATFGLYWLSLLFIISGLIYCFLNSSNKIAVFVKRAKVIRYAMVFLFILFVAIFFRLFLFGVYHIPSPSMKNTLMVGDLVLVNKLAYGPSLPRSGYEIPWLNLLWYLNKETRKDFGKKVWPYYRLSGYSAIQQNDVMVFKLPGTNDFFVVKRCIGRPGDSLQITNGLVYSNKRAVALAENITSSYKIYYNNYKQLRKSFKTLEPGTGVFQPGAKKGGYQVATLSVAQKNRLGACQFIDSISPVIDQNDSIAEIFPHNKKFAWGLDNFGPVRIPKKGLEVELDDTNFILYQAIINKLEAVKLVKKANGFYLGNKQIKKYKFSENCYFVMGDKRHASIDSRYWGFLPESCIIGKAVLVVYSNNNGFKWERLFKWIE